MFLKLDLSREERRLLLLACLLLPLRTATYAAKKKHIPVSFYVIREHLKLKAKDAEHIELIHSSLPRALKAMALLREKGSIPAGSMLTVQHQSCNTKVGHFTKEITVDSPVF